MRLHSITRSLTARHPPVLRGYKPFRRIFLTFLALSLVLTSVNHSVVLAQTPVAAVTPQTTDESAIFKMERVPVEGGAELITVLARLDGLETSVENKWVPLVAVLRDTLGDPDPENDRLRYVWPLTYTRPSFKQRMLGAVPFFYARAANKHTVSNNSPPAVMDLSTPSSDVWNKIFWIALQNVLLDTYGIPIKASTRSYSRNIGDYRKSHIIRALSVLSIYQALNGRSVFTSSEMAEIQSRLTLADKTFGGLVDDLNLQPYYEKTTITEKDDRAQNWELLRQRAEAESLYFEPLQMPDGSTTHALLWIAKTDLTKPLNHRFSGRFLNISDPRSDKRLLDWQGYVETRYFDNENRPVAADAPGAQPVEMIPLALYGLDNPKIPMLLVDFRDNLNAKKREMSRRVLQDITKNILSLSQFGNLPYFLGRTVFDFVTGRRGIDINQPSRLRTYSQLKLLLALNDSLEPELRGEIANRLERVSLNPLENDLDVEAKLASQQYQALLQYAQRQDGLPVKLERDRRAEMVPLKHSRTEQMFFNLANVLSFGKYVHREDPGTDTQARLDVARRLAYHTRFLRQVAKSNFQIDVAWNLDDVRRSLSYIADHGDEADSEAIVAAGRIFSRTHDEETRRTCLESLSRIATPKAKSELLRISQNKDLDPSWRDTIKSYITQTIPPQPPPASARQNSAGRSDQQ